ncbi:cytochrome P450 [Colletotrichum orchidophilum]|uniref:Cytochrome P450 n=1 Tax=Colletotrichum orchidophilum TaxID=1209926 RepID=A0A1G4AWG4_9PEZI|nr:cytochrome P450 [Colletotrichum orchidophilum]OHE93433.1 cytochrome P450 [Colletotrichum orchidophilum]
MSSVCKPLSMVSLIFVGACGVFILLVAHIRRTSQRHANKSLPLPPGPPQLPILGNLFNKPEKPFSWMIHYQWKYKYGPVVHYREGRQSHIVLTTVEAAHDLLNKRASNYSGRSFSPYAGELVCKKYNMLFLQYDAQLRLHQRLHVQGLSPRSAALYYPIIELESLQLLNDLLSEIGEKSGEEKEGAALDPHWHFRRAASSNVSVIAWGYRLMRGNLEHEAQIDFFDICPTSAVLKSIPPWYDTFPWLRNLPYTISPWKRAAKSLFEREEAHHLANFRSALKRPGYNLSKQVASSTDRLDTGMSETEQAWVVGALTLANGDTSVAILCWFVIAMLTYPHFLLKAQAMIDEIVGHDRLPVYEDREKLPYVDAMIEEVLRWRPILPAGMDHAAVEEDEYKGYKIPKGATVIPSQWAITRDKDVYGADCNDYRPERWLESKDLPKTAFGYGRRLCPGRHVGREGLWILFARLIWAFRLEQPTDPVTLKKQMIDPMSMLPMGIVIGPDPFEALFTPRGPWVEDLVHSNLESTEKDVGKIMEQVEAIKGL